MRLKHSLISLVLGSTLAAMTTLPSFAAAPPPHGPVTRATLALNLVHSLKLSEASEGPWFRDVSSKTPAAHAIETVTGDGLMQGTSTFTFSPNRPASRLDLARALVGALGLTDTAQADTKAPPVTDAKTIASSDYGIVDLALALHLMSPSHGQFAPRSPVSWGLWRSAWQKEQSTSSVATAKVADGEANALWMGFPYFVHGSTDISSGQKEDLATQVESGEWVLPGSVDWASSCGTLTKTYNATGKTDVEVFTAPQGPASCYVTATIPGTTIHQSLTFKIWAASGLAMTPPPVVTQGHKVTVTADVVGLSPTGDGTTTTDLGDNDRALTLTISGSVSSSTTITAKDHGGVAHFTWTPPSSGTYSMSLSSHGLPTVSGTSQVTSSPVATAELSSGQNTLTYGETTPLTLSLSPAGAGLSGVSSLPISVSVQGNASLQNVDSTVSVSSAETSTGTPVATVVGGPSPGHALVTVSSPEDAFSPVTTNLTVSPEGTISVGPIPTQHAGATVKASATLSGAPAGTKVTFTPVAPDGEEGLLATHSTVNSATATTNAEGVASISLADQYMSGTYTLDVAALGYQDVHTQYTIDPGPAVKMEAAVAPSPFIDQGHSAHLSVAAVDQYGNPVPGVTIPIVTHLQGKGARYTITRSSVVGQGSVGTITAGKKPATLDLTVHTPAFGGETETLPVRVITSPLQLLQGKGTWATYGVWSQLGAKKLIRDMKAQGMTHLYLETAASGYGFYGQLPLDRVVDAAHDAGIAVITWNYDALWNVPQDEAAAKSSTDYRTRLGSGTDGFTADLEENLTTSAVGHFSQYVRQLLGPESPYVATIYPPQSHVGTPLKTLARYADALAPMDYWHAQERDYTYQSVYNYVAESVKEIRSQVPNVPIEVIAETYDMFSGSERGDYNPAPMEDEAAVEAATDAKASSISFYDLATETNDEASLISSMPYPFTMPGKPLASPKAPKTAELLRAQPALKPPAPGKPTKHSK